MHTDKYDGPLRSFAGDHVDYQQIAILGGYKYVDYMLSGYSNNIFGNESNKKDKDNNRRLNDEDYNTQSYWTECAN